MKEARLYHNLKDNKIQCDTCAHHCRLTIGQRGICGVMENRDGVLISLVYGKTIACHVDPIEKKPLFHFYPGTRSLSMATVGCNMHCLNCQNADISQMPRDHNRIQGQDLPPELLVQSAIDRRCRTIAYTYTEPVIFWDYAYDTAQLAHEKGIRNIFVTNGYFSEESLKAISPYLDGANVDLKFMNDKNYRSICGAKLQPVLDTIRSMKALHIWVEVTTLLIPGLNDSQDELTDLARFIHDCDPGIPWHISRFHPTYKMMDRPPTPIVSIQKARQIGLDVGLKYVYTGNVPGEEGESTFCHHCGARLIHRWGFEVTANRLVDGKCPECSMTIDGVW
ncbi:AmmeMemoRadiSam system radical SAM enzyme [bacterium]|nr:AmmeMemoRadiSam system radical SAM enzyme [bacterium]RQV94379.1 MAG: AmmeMemoRadiSam system radical SAM enzyme [bacterium]